MYVHLGDMILERSRSASQQPAFRVRRGDAYHDVLWAEVAPRLDAIAAGLLAGVTLDDGATVSILGSTSMDWVIVDFAALSIGLRTVPIYASLLPSEVGFMHVDTGAQLAIVENAIQLEKLRTARAGFTFFERSYTPSDFSLRGKVIVVDPTGLPPADDWESLAEVEARGRAALDTAAGEVSRRRRLIQRSDLATFTYTSGTTGAPKAVMQTHDNMLSMLEAVEITGIFDAAAREHGLFLFLPLAHSFGRLVELAAPFFGAPLIVSSVPTLAADLAIARPGFFPAAPRIYEKMMAKIISAIDESPPLRRKIAYAAIAMGRRASTHRASGRPLPVWLRMPAYLAEVVVLRKLRARLGLDRTSIVLSGSAPLRADVHEFFLAVGLTLIEAYGLTETCPGLTTNRTGHIRVGSVGQAFDGVVLRISEDGEVLAKGKNITSGYLNRPEATSDAIDSDGWFHTGDLGSLDADGFLRITGRKKELLKTSGGKYIAPIKIEASLKGHPIVQEAVVIGDNRNFCAVLFALDSEMLSSFAAREGIPADPQHERVHAVLAELVKQTNAGLASFETIKTYRVVPGPFSVDGGELTASLKMKRRAIYDKYAELIESMYAARH